MDDTTRAMAVLAAATLILAPLVNGVLEEAAATADRIFLKDSDWTGDPPENPPDVDPPDKEPPEDLNQSDLDGNYTGPGGGASCNLERRLAAGWQHRTYQEDPTTAVQERRLNQATQPIDVREDDVGMGIAFQSNNTTGALNASVYPEGQQENPPWYVDHPTTGFRDKLSEDGKITRPDLTTGRWIARLDVSQAEYDDLTFVVFLFSCQQEAPQ